jgi:transposase-like protein
MGQLHKRKAALTAKTFEQAITAHQTPAKIVIGQLQYEDRDRRTFAKHAVEEQGGGPLIVYDHKDIVRRFTDSVANWWTEEVETPQTVGLLRN